MPSAPPTSAPLPPPRETPFFSVAVPCCDVAPYLDECIASLLSQPFSDWECLLYVEDSRDATLETARRHAAADPRFRVFTGPRSGSCSVPRNRCIEEARGEYLLFLDGDDTLVPGALARVASAIAARPGADLYPCAILVRDDRTGLDGELRDNYPPDFHGELTGPQATLMAYARKREPCPMLQMTVHRRRYLVDNALACLPGVRRQDSEFTARARYLAARVVPLHEKLYVYRIRPGSASTESDGPGYFLNDYAPILRSLLAFHARVSREAGFDRRISFFWAAHWLTWLFYYWFSPRAVRHASRQRRRDTLAKAFPDGFRDLDALVAASTAPRKTAAAFVKLAVRHPSAAWLADVFFLGLYTPLTALRDRLRRR
jgi:glycosyltransferase involved in cell wall biosynthesis